jgi:hypothetical protein
MISFCGHFRWNFSVISDVFQTAHRFAAGRFELPDAAREYFALKGA